MRSLASDYVVGDSHLTPLAMLGFAQDRLLRRLKNGSTPDEGLASGGIRNTK
jgi:hypothetical protein